MKDRRALEDQLSQMNERLRPIATRPVDISNPNWTTQLRQRPDPLDEAAIRPAAQALLETLIDAYQTGDADEREAIRELLQKYQHFTWAAHLPRQSMSAEYFRRELLLLSMRDQARDPRDELAYLWDLCKKARAAGIQAESILAEVAHLSSDENRYGMGTTRSFLLKA